MEAHPREIQILDEEWFDKLMNKLLRSDFRAHGQILVRLDRVEEGNLGDHRPVGEGVVELRFIRSGAGYRVYIGQEADTVIILYAGTKATQAADIGIARRIWKDYGMAEKTKSYREWLDKTLANPKIAANYLSMAYEDSHGAFLQALRKVSAAQGKTMTELADVCGVSRESLYRMLSENGNPTSENERAILSALGFTVAFVVSEQESRSKPNKS